MCVASVTRMGINLVFFSSYPAVIAVSKVSITQSRRFFLTDSKYLLFFIFRVEKYILEQIEALEDKVAAASMQVPVSKTADNSSTYSTLCYDL